MSDQAPPPGENASLVPGPASSEATATLSPETIENMLETFNRHQALKFIPVFTFLVVVMVIGTVGNILVLYVYGKRFRKTSSNYFIASMAVFDLLACIIGLPTELYDLVHSYTFYSQAMCKISRYSESVMVYGSAIILVEIAVDRYFKICRPLMMIELYKIKMMCVGAGIAAVLISVPSFVLYGISHSATPDPRVKGHDCSIEEKYKKQAFSHVYYYLLGTTFVVTLLLLSGLYIRIWVEIKRRKKLVIGDIARSSMREEIPMSNTQRKSRAKIFSSSMSTSDDDEPQTPSRRVTASIRPRLESIAETVNRMKVSRTTVVLFAVTVAFVISYLPGIIIMTCRSAIKDLEETQSVAVEILSKLFARFYFINNAINPVIYSFLNVNFRRRCVLLVRKLVTCKKTKQKARFPEKTDSQKSTKSTKHELLL